MTQDLLLRRKWKLRAHDQQVIFVKKAGESAEHVLMKAFIWALYLPDYPDMLVEVRIGDRYKPDLVSMDPVQAAPRFWGEAGQVGRAKIHKLVRRIVGFSLIVLAIWMLMPLLSGGGHAHHASG